MLFQRNRFQKRELHVGNMLRPVLTLAVFLLVFVLLLAGVRSVRKTTQQQELQNLASSVRRSAAECYALEGRYPESLDYLKEHYGITYDESRYLVSYQAYGSNMLPTITVLPLK